ncbi:MAG: hypothetical protein NXI21_05315 [Alphaproteobacteria bacterium]|nr:hypothetical protein [Alphaproteobacteria bacterium]
MSLRVRLFAAALLLTAATPEPAWAGGADVVAVEIDRTGEGVYRFSVTVRHADEGWDHYADRFVVLAPDGRVLGTRVLHHPHVEEQPFTRALSGVEAPAGIDTVTVRAHDSVHGFDGRAMTVRIGD